jgi:molybdopterin molybdotransferase
MMGIRQATPIRIIKAKTKERDIPIKGRTEFIRVRLEKKVRLNYMDKTGPQGSGILTSLSEADGIAVIGEEQESVPKGAELQVILIKKGGSLL